MKVTGNRIKSYVLDDRAQKTDYEGAVYEATNLRKTTSTTYVKLYTPMMRTDDQMNKVINAANGMGGILGPTPIEPVYQRGKFVGYSYEEYLSPGVPPPPPKRTSYGPIIAAVVLGVVLSLLVRFVLINFLLSGASELAGRMLCKGMIMILAGWIAGFFGFQIGGTSTEKYTVNSCIFAVIGFAAACVAVYVITSLLAAIILAVTMGVSMILQVLPDLIASVIVIVILVKVAKSVFR